MQRKILIGIGILLVLVMLFLVFGRKYYTKRFSPEDHAQLADGKLKVLVFYNRPYKKGRNIFGGLVPYGKTWRTGANEATWFECSQDLVFQDKVLKAGRYSLWTVPGEKSWKVIFNSVIPPWGVNYNSEAARDPKTDALEIEVPVQAQDFITEQFTITLQKAESAYQMNFIWDTILVSVDFRVSEPADK